MSDWDTFLKGHWQREMPQKAGQYRLWAMDCGPGGFGIVFEARPGVFQSVQKWAGLWWSEPMPDLPIPSQDLDPAYHARKHKK